MIFWRYAATLCLAVCLFALANVALERALRSAPPQPRKRDTETDRRETDSNSEIELPSLANVSAHGQLQLPPAAVAPADERFACANMSLLTLLGTKPIARGWNKEVWRAEWAANLHKPYAVKRRRLDRAKNAADLARKQQYALAQLQREWARLREFRHWNIVTGYGGCVDAAAPDEAIGLVTELVDAYSLAELLRQAMPWCVWTKMAIDFAMLIKYLHEAEAGPAVHCDWKAEQFVVRKKDYRVVLVDVDSLVKYERGSAYLAGEPCSGTAEAECAQMGEECFQEEARKWDVPDTQCDVERKQCVGFDTKSLVWSFARGLLLDFLGAPTDMFNNRRGPSPDAVRGTAMFRETFANIIRNSTKTDKNERWDIYKVLAEMRDVYSRANGKECLTRWNWHRRLA